MQRGRLGVARTADLAAELPFGARCWEYLNADSAWPASSYLLAEMADALNGANWQRAGGKGKKPKPIPRPADSRKQAEADERTQAMAAAWLARQQQRQEHMAPE